MKTNLRPVALAIAALSSLLSPAVRGQSEEAAAPPAGEAPQKIEVVSRRDSHLSMFGDLPSRSVPLSMRVITADEFADRGAKSLDDILRNDPAWLSNAPPGGLQAGVSFGSLRGFGVSKYMYNGLPQNYSFNFVSPEATERVEVLRGASGFSYGFMSPGGAVNVVTKQPTAAPLLDLRAGVEDTGLLSAHLDVSRRFLDGRVGVRLNVAGAEGEQILGVQTQRGLGSLSADWQLSDATTLGAFVDVQRVRQEGAFSGSPYLFDENGEFVPATGPDKVPYQGDWYEPLHKALGVRLLHDFSDTTQFTASFQATDYFEGYVQSAFFPIRAGGLTDYNVYIGTYDLRDRSASAMLNTRFSIAGMPHRLTVGAQASRNTTRNRGSFATLATDYDLYNPAPIDNPFTDQEPRDQPLTNNNSSAERGVFVSDVIDLRKGARLLLGARWSQIVFENRDLQTGKVVGPVDRQETVSPMVGVIVDLSPRLSVFANATNGLECGGVAPLDASNPGERMPVLLTQQYELGLRWDANPLGLRVDATLFQIERPSEYYLGAGTPYVQDGMQRHRGLELLVSGKATRQLTFSGGATFMDAKVTGTDNPDARGDRATGVPRTQVALNADYELSAITGLTLSGGVLHVGARERSLPNDDQEAPAFTTLSLGASYAFRWGGTPLELNATVDNATNVVHAAGSGYMYGAPRTARIGLKASL